ncbi:MAG TPA: hypothetical protein VFZ21_32495 [Gemmatimonadaceae bacterium]|nr:hypothetical protein [Gemmatimonadaceae bacterium]
MYSASSKVGRRVLRGSLLALVGLGLVAACTAASTVNTSATEGRGARVGAPATELQSIPGPRLGPDTL